MNWIKLTDADSGKQLWCDFTRAIDMHREIDNTRIQYHGGVKHEWWDVRETPQEVLALARMNLEEFKDEATPKAKAELTEAERRTFKSHLFQLGLHLEALLKDPRPSTQSWRCAVMDVLTEMGAIEKNLG